MDPRYNRAVQLLLADFENALGGDLERAQACEMAVEEPWQWARYVEQHMHGLYLERFFPVHQLDLDALSPDGLGTIEALPPPQGRETMVARVRREHFNRLTLQPPLQCRLYGVDPRTNEGETVGRRENAR
eukprot:s3888_g2.t1